MNALTLLTGGFGSGVIADTTERSSKRYAMIVVVEDCVFTTLESGDYDPISGDAIGHISELDAARQDFTNTDTIPVGTVLRPHSVFFTKVKLASGKVNWFKG